MLAPGCTRTMHLSARSGLAAFKAALVAAHAAAGRSVTDEMRARERAVWEEAFGSGGDFGRRALGRRDSPLWDFYLYLYL